MSSTAAPGQQPQAPSAAPVNTPQPGFTESIDHINQQQQQQMSFADPQQPSASYQPPAVTPVASDVASVPYRVLMLAVGRDRAMAEKIAPSFFKADGTMDGTQLMQNEDGSVHLKIGDQAAWKDATQALGMRSMESIKATAKMKIAQVGEFMDDGEPGDTHAIQSYMEHRTEESWAEPSERMGVARAKVGMASLHLAKGRGFIPGQTIIPFTTPAGSTGELDLGSGIISTVDHATGQRKQFPKAQSDDLAAKMFAGDSQFFRKVTHTAIPTIEESKAPSAGSADEMMKMQADRLQKGKDIVGERMGKSVELLTKLKADVRAGKDTGHKDMTPAQLRNAQLDQKAEERAIADAESAQSSKDKITNDAKAEYIKKNGRAPSTNAEMLAKIHAAAEPTKRKGKGKK